METIEVNVPTVHCTACKLNIEESLDELNGVAGSDVQLDARQVTVTYDPDSVDPDTITAAIEDAGYPVTQLTTVGPVRQRSRAGRP